MASMPERLGILGGAFDPPHVGHLILGETARQQCTLDRVLFLPTGQPPHKQEQIVTPGHHRLEMTRLAVADHESFATSTIDMDRPPPHYTSSLRPILAKAYPSAHLILVVGGDSLSDLPAWHEPQSILRHWEIAVLPRPGIELDWNQLEESVPGIRAATTILDGPSVAISSTQIRRWVRAGCSLRYLMPTRAARYIMENGLYAHE